MSTAIVEQNGTVVLQDQTAIPVVVTDTNTVTIEVGTPTVVLAGAMGPPGASELSAIADVDVTNLQDGGILVYAQATQRWTATNTLERQILEGGQF